MRVLKHINKMGLGLYLNKIGMGLLLLGLVLGSSILTRINGTTYAANTLQGSNTEVITIGGTTDGLAPNAATSPYTLSGDGNVIPFTSTATNLPGASGSNGLYAYNIKANTTSRVDVSSSGVPSNGSVTGTLLTSETGRYITWVTTATNLIDGTTQPSGYYFIYKHDIQTGVTTLIDSEQNGLSQNKDRNLAISNDGRFVVLASRYIANAYPYSYGITLGDSISGSMSWTSIAKGSELEGSNNGTNVNASMSCDGAFAVYNDAGPTIKMVDLRKGSVTMLASASATSVSPLISCNGRYVLYATQNRTDITPTPSGMDSYMHLVRYDRITGERQYINSNSSGVFSTAHYSYSSSVEPQGNTFAASIADTGDVVFKYNGYMYLKHLSDSSGTLESIGITASGSYINIAGGALTQNGRYIWMYEDPYNFGLAPSPSSKQVIRVKTGL